MQEAFDLIVEKTAEALKNKALNSLKILKTIYNRQYYL